MTAEQLESERRFGRIAGIIGLIGAVLFIVANFVGSADYAGAEGLAEQLALFEPDKSQVQLQLFLQGFGMALFAAPLMALFRAAAARSSTVRPGLIGLTVAGPIFLGASFIARYYAIDDAAVAFLDPSNLAQLANEIAEEALPPDGSVKDVDDAAGDVLTDQGPFDIYAGLDFAGRLGLVFGIVYTGLNAMRTGLLTRFWGTLAMALGVGVLLIGPSALFVLGVSMSLLVAGFWPGGMPRAWEEGKAIPWPKPGESLAGGDPGRDPEEPARPEDFEGTATPVDEASERPGRRDNKRKRKRKQRG